LPVKDAELIDVRSRADRHPPRLTVHVDVRVSEEVDIVTEDDALRRTDEVDMSSDARSTPRGPAANEDTSKARLDPRRLATAQSSESFPARRSTPSSIAERSIVANTRYAERIGRAAAPSSAPSLDGRPVVPLQDHADLADVEHQLGGVRPDERRGTLAREVHAVTDGLADLDALVLAPRDEELHALDPLELLLDGPFTGDDGLEEAASIAAAALGAIVVDAASVATLVLRARQGERSFAGDERERVPRGAIELVLLELDHGEEGAVAAEAASLADAREVLGRGG
jgi:hypothetical protein